LNHFVQNYFYDVIYSVNIRKNIPEDVAMVFFVIYDSQNMVFYLIFSFFVSLRFCLGSYVALHCCINHKNRFKPPFYLNSFRHASCHWWPSHSLIHKNIFFAIPSCFVYILQGWLGHVRSSLFNLKRSIWDLNNFLQGGHLKVCVNKQVVGKATLVQSKLLFSHPSFIR